MLMLRTAVGVAALLAGLAASAAVADVGDLGSNCVVSVLNRTARVEADGTWVVPNVPSGQGPVRVRATCTEPDGILRSGQSGLVMIPSNGLIRVEDISFDSPIAIPTRLTLSGPATTLTSSGQVVQLSAVATLPDGSTLDLSAAGLGTDYRSSNPAIASVDADGVVTALVSGAVLVSAQNDGALGIVRLQVLLSGDSDGDGLPDDWEILNGFDPNNPVDALDDGDGDGLSTVQEYQSGLNPLDSDSDDDGLLDGREVNTLGTDRLRGDTDGDGLWDGLEVETASNPLDPNSFNLAAALTGIEVTPAEFELVVNTVVGEASRRLRVVGALRDGRSLDVTSGRYGTGYSSSDLLVANFGAEDGRVYAGQNGSASIQVGVAGFADVAAVVVRSFAPTALSFVRLNAANGVALYGDFALVAAGSAGLQIVDVSNLLAPFVASQVNTGGNANDVRVAGDFAYIADGGDGLVVVDVSAPLLPRVVGALDTPGVASDVALAPPRAYVADGTGLSVVDVSDPAVPRLLGGLSLSGNCRGVEVAGNLVFVAADDSGVHVVDVTDPTAPSLIATAPTRTDGRSNAADLAVRDGLLYVADGAQTHLGGLQVLSTIEPAAPVLVGASVGRYGLTGVALDGALALASDYFFRNSVLIFDISTAAPVFRADLAFPAELNFSDPQGTGLAVRNGIVYVTAGLSMDNQVYGGGVLQIGRYLELEGQSLQPLNVAIVSPIDGASVRARSALTVQVDARNDTRVDEVQLLVDGAVVARDFKAPFNFPIVAPDGVSLFRIGAVAKDYGIGDAVAEEITVQITPNSEPTVALLTPTAGMRFTVGTPIPLAAQADDDNSVEYVEFFLDGVPVGTDFEAPFRGSATAPAGRSESVVGVIVHDDQGATAEGVPATITIEPDDPPFVAFLAPPDGQPAPAGGLVSTIVVADDDVRVTSVRMLADGVEVGELLVPPFFFDVTVPLGATQLHLRVIATDSAGHETAAELTLAVTTEELLTEARGVVLDVDGAPRGFAEVRCLGVTGTSASDGTFQVPDVPSGLGRVRCVAETSGAGGQVLRGSSASVVPIVGGITDVGTIQLRRFDGFLYPGAKHPMGGQALDTGDFNGDGIPDLVTAHHFGDAVAIALGRASGGFEDAEYFAAGADPRDVVVGDFDGDTFLDVAVANRNSPSMVSLLLGNGDGTFAAPASFPVGSGPSGLAAADFNGDGLLDLATANNHADSVSLLFGDGDGGFTAGAPLAAGDYPAEIRAGDLNGDNVVDLVTCQRNAGTVRVFLGLGDGTFTIAQTFSLGLSYPDGMALVDADGDGMLDVATASEYRNEVRLLLGNGDGTLRSGPTLPAGTDPIRVAIADADADGLADVLASNEGSYEVSFFRGLGGGSFAAQVMIPTGTMPTDLAVLDVNTDGLADVVTANYWDDVSLLLRHSAGYFETDIRYAAGDGPRDVAVGDLNGDGALDLAVASTDSDQVAVLLGRGDGTFVAERRYATGSAPYAVAISDMNGDGKLDVVVANAGANSVQVHPGVGDGTLGTPTSVPVGPNPDTLVCADLDGNGIQDALTASPSYTAGSVSVVLGLAGGTLSAEQRYPVARSPYGMTVADLNGDGALDVATVSYDDAEVSILFGNGNGTFQPQVAVPLGIEYSFPNDIAAADLNADGATDLLVTLDVYSPPLLAVLLNDGAGSFTESTTVAGYAPYDLTVGDPNGDGIPDAIVTSWIADHVFVVPGNGDGTFQPPLLFATGASPYAVAVGDLNGDGLLDLVTANYWTNGVSVFLHR